MTSDPATQLARDVRDVQHLLERSRIGHANNSSLKPFHSDKVRSPSDSREAMSERAFVRAFGDKVKRVRWSQRADFVGLLLLGRFQGIFITSDNSGGRKVRLVDVDGDKMHVTKRYLRVKEHDSISNLQRGLLKYVR